MPHRPAPRNSRLDAATVDRLLSAASAPGYPRLVQLLAAAAAPDSPRPLHGVESVIVAYRRDIPAAIPAGAKAVGTRSAGGASQDAGPGFLTPRAETPGPPLNPPAQIPTR